MDLFNEQQQLGMVETGVESIRRLMQFNLRDEGLNVDGGESPALFETFSKEKHLNVIDHYFSRYFISPPNQNHFRVAP